MRIHYFQHVPFEGLGSIADWIRRKKHALSGTRFFSNEKLPEIDPIDWLIVMGGPMGIYDIDPYPWLNAERKFIETAISRGKVVLGICLGAQLVADALGAKIYQNRHKEIGWFPVTFFPQEDPSGFFDVFPEKLSVFHWHGDTFDLPPGASLIASSDACVNQAFTFNDQVFAFQFHLESTEESVRELIRHCGDEIKIGPYIQSSGEMLSEKSRFQDINKLMDSILESIESRV